ncbi:MAG TPA: helix-turn-helix domain-containing protein [Opitutaceae bacterium]|nr:helix-turn-helix domain-containing protein [Opitutaceae bacterium]
MPRTAAESAGLRRVPIVFAKDVADAAGVSPKTVYRWLARYRANPKDARGLPHLVRLGPPWRIPAPAAEALLGTSATA